MNEFLNHIQYFCQLVEGMLNCLSRSDFHCARPCHIVNLFMWNRRLFYLIIYFYLTQDRF